jgi:hypothetical protein
MKPHHLPLIVFLAAMSALSCHSYRTVKFLIGDSVFGFKIDLPRGYNFQHLVSEHGKEDRYSYPDSSVIYITSFPNTLNYANIQSQGMYSKFFLAEQALDTLSLSGKDASGLSWKDRVTVWTSKGQKTGYVIIGYTKASPQRQIEFEKAIETIRTLHGIQKLTPSFDP